MPHRTIPGTGVRYALITFDGTGAERTDDPEGGTFSRALLDGAAAEPPTHVFMFSHGWRGDVPSAIDQYDRWIGAMHRLADDRAAMGPSFKPLFVGLHWPSEPWGEESLAEQAAEFAAAAGAGIELVLETAVAHFGGSDRVRTPLEIIFRAFQDDPAARVIPPHVVAAYHDLANAIGFTAGAGPDAPPEQEGAPLDPQAAVRAERLASAGEAFGLRSTFRNGMLAGLRQASFWLMKRRARLVGEGGMHAFVSQLQQTAGARIHLMGHSFGCIVASSILGGPGGTGRLFRPVESAVLVQGAMSLWSFAEAIPGTGRAGYFRHVLRGALDGPLVTTHSVHDKAVSIAYPAAVGLVNEFDYGTDLPRFGGIGTWGIQGTAIAEAGTVLDSHARYELTAGRIYNLDGSRYIPGHSAIDGPEVAHLLWQAVGARARV